MVDINVDLLQWFINFFGGVIKNENMSKKELAEELQKPIIRKFKKKGNYSHSPFIDNIQGADLADMQLISKFNKGSRFLLWVVDIFNKYEWVLPLKDMKGITINVFQKILNEYNHKPHKAWVDKGS